MWKNILVSLALLLLLVIVLMMITIPCQAYDFWKGEFDPWTKQDKERQIILIALQGIDWEYTRSGAIRNVTMESSNIPLYYEENPLISGNSMPTVSQVDRYFSYLIIGNLAVNYILPEKWRKVWQYTNIIAEVYCINNCVSAGIKLQF